MFPSCFSLVLKKSKTPVVSLLFTVSRQLGLCMSSITFNLYLTKTVVNIKDPGTWSMTQTRLSRDSVPSSVCGRATSSVSSPMQASSPGCSGDCALQVHPTLQFKPSFPHIMRLDWIRDEPIIDPNSCTYKKPKIPSYQCAKIYTFGRRSTMAILTYWSGVIVLRWKYPDIERPFRVPLAVPVIALLSSLYLVIGQWCTKTPRDTSTSRSIFYCSASYIS